MGLIIDQIRQTIHIGYQPLFTDIEAKNRTGKIAESDEIFQTFGFFTVKIEHATSLRGIDMKVGFHFGGKC